MRAASPNYSGDAMTANLTSNPIQPETFAKLRELNSCAVANAIETFGERLRNSGFTNSTVRCLFEDFPPLVGYAATIRIRTSEPPMEGDNYYYRLDWLDHLLSVPSPRVLIVEDLDPHPGLGSFIGDVHTNILHVLECMGMATNGAVRNIEAARGLQFQLFARNLTVSHAFAHIVDFGGPVVIGNMAVRPGDLLHGDRHGIQTVPIGIAHKIPAVAHRMAGEERQIIELCRSGAFSIDKLRLEVDALRIKRRHLRD
jgi:4-hydroxy-4-methyl-2-oxoglutarate aldolase